MKKVIFGFAFLLGWTVNAQKVLTLEDAKSITLANNFGIQIAKNNIEISKNLTDKKVNGYLPTVSFGSGINGNLGGTLQNFSNGTEARTSNAFTWGSNASVRSDYTIFDKRRSLTLEQLKESLALSNLQLRQTIEQNLLQVYTAFFQIAQLNENVAVLEEAIGISKERIRRANYQLEFGQGNSLAVLNAKVDVQRDSVNLLNAKMNVENAKRNLNALMGLSAGEADFEVQVSNNLISDLTLETLLKQAKENNATLEVNRQNLIVNEKNLDLIDAEKKPTISAGASYDFNFTDNPEGSFFLNSRSQGISGNVGLNWNLFDASRKIRKQNAVLNIANQKLQFDQISLELERDLTNAWANYQNAIFILKVEEAAVETNKENFARTEEQLKIGRLTSIEFRQAQLNLLNAQTSLNNARFNVKLQEIQLLQLAGRIME